MIQYYVFGLLIVSVINFILLLYAIMQIEWNRNVISRNAINIFRITEVMKKMTERIKKLDGVK